MNLFATLLPGVRALRAPLSSGYLSLLALWLVYSDDSPDRDAADSLADQLFDLEGVASGFGVIVAISFLAYLIGTLTEWGTTAALQEVVWRKFSSFDLWVKQEGLSELIRDEPVNPEIATGLVESNSFDRRWRRREFSGIRTTLMVEHPLLYNEYDRLTSEAEFRTAIALPLAALLAILAVQFDSAFFAGIIAVAALLVQAFQFEKEGTAVLVQSVVGGTVTSPFILTVARIARE